MQAALNRLRIRHAYASDTRNAVYAVASERPIDVLGDWLRRLAEEWDGEPRVDGALAYYWRAEAGPLTTAVSRVMLLGVAARGLKPGCELHTVPVLIGAQGCGKSSSLKALMWGARANWPDPTAAHGYGAGRRYCGSKLEIGKKDALASIRGHLVWELAELASVKRADIDDVKAWITQSADTFRPPFAHEDVTYQRTVAPIANVNPDSTGHVVINRDTSGGRRWAPVRVAPGYVYEDARTHRLGVREAELIRDREQLLGEAARRVLDGEQWHPTDAEAALLAPAVAEVSEDPTRSDPWYAPIAKWARGQSKPFAIAAVFHSALDMVDVAKHSRGEALRIAHVLRDLGYVCGAPNNGVRKWRKAEA
jgi:predicted P-loop ATPase